jgi:hypothetical protein
MERVNGRCVCLPDFYELQPNLCLKCPNNTHWNTTQCTCNDGFFLA